FEWYNKAAANKHNGAQFKVGECYANGWGVLKNPTKASIWYQKAAANGSSLAKERLTDIKNGQLAAKSREKSLAIERKKAKEQKQRLEAERVEKARLEKTRQQRLAAEKKRLREERLAKLKHKKVPQKNTPKPSSANKAAKTRNIGIPQLVNQVLKGQWRTANIAAGNLPSAVNNCLKSSETEIICFSTEQQRVVGNSNVMFTTKATINNFKSNGQFKVKYYYNVLDVSSSNKSGPAIDPAGLRLATGWQEPQQVMECQSIDQKRLSCLQGKYKFSFTN
ncbi:MAG: sel1 repeat family protein, partial [Gammaproteobacteria bacterium]|nr:sel1 repeat family protein [Gammaproteobacteria bacterium]